MSTFQHRRSKSSRPRLSRTLAIFVSALCLTGQLLAAAHEATQRHVLCAEHGEITHLRSESIASAAANPHAARGVADAVGAVAGDGAGTSDHDHCAAVIGTRRLRTDPIVVVATAPAIAPPPAPAGAPVLPPPSDRILLSAPKNAPPC